MLDTKNILSLQPLNHSLLHLWKECADFQLNDVGHTAPMDFSILEGKSKQINEKLNFGIKPIGTGFEDKEQVTEFAAYGLAALIAKENYSLSIVSRTPKNGEGVDLILSDSKTVDPNNFLLPLGNQCAKLEVKGTRYKKYLNSRLTAGINQSKKAWAKGKVYIIAVEFESPSATVEIKP